MDNYKAEMNCHRDKQVLDKYELFNSFEYFAIGNCVGNYWAEKILFLFCLNIYEYENLQ